MVACRFLFCKQKTAYELRISDWSSDVCSSDLDGARSAQIRRPPGRHADAGMQTAAWTPDFRFASSGEAEWGRRVDHPAGSRFHFVAQVGCRGDRTSVV